MAGGFHSTSPFHHSVAFVANVTSKLPSALEYVQMLLGYVLWVSIARAQLILGLVFSLLSILSLNFKYILLPIHFQKRIICFI